MTRNQFARWRNYQKTLMAVFWLSESDGMRCYATWAELAAETRLCRDTVKLYVNRLEAAGIIRIPRVRDRLNRRTIVLLDHPDSARYLASLERSGRSTVAGVGREFR